jgi:hypothetical protein
MQTIEQHIRERAYHLWIANGRREGEADMHWLTAERELLAATAASASAETAVNPARKRATRAAKPRRAA